MFTMTVTGAETFTIPKECIESVIFTTNIPKDCAACCSDVSKTLIIKGIILAALDCDPLDSTLQIALWSAVPSGLVDSYRSVKLTHIQNGIAVREYTFPNAFIVDYSEDFDNEEGEGAFTLTIKQKKDQIEHIAVNGGF